VICLSVGDWNGDGHADLAVYRPTTGDWHFSINSVTTTVHHGQVGDMPVPADYDGDGTLDYSRIQAVERAHGSSCSAEAATFS
jgi:hypothetical protein